MVFIAQSNVETILADLHTQVIPVLEAPYTELKSNPARNFL